MNVLQALNETYIAAEKGGLVGQPITKDQPVPLLPLYHESKRSTGFNIIHVLFDEKGKLVEASFIPNEEYIVYPVSESSIGRSAGISPHPLVDKLSYLSPTFKPEHHQEYLESLHEWKKWADLNDPQLMLDITFDYMSKHDLYVAILESFKNTYEWEYDEESVILSWLDGDRKRTKKINFAEVFVTFGIEFQDSMMEKINVSTDLSLQQSHIAYTESLFADRDVEYCSVSGELTYCVNKHPGMLGNAKIIGVSNHKEVHYGRFCKTENIFNLGFRTSQRIHLMLQFLLTNPDNNMWLGGSQHLVNWFSDDITNKIQFSPTGNFVSDIEDVDEFADTVGGDNSEDSDRADEGQKTLGGPISFNLGKHIAGKRQTDLEFSRYYVMIVEKTSNGRIAIKYFRSFRQSDLMTNLAHWYLTFSWPYPVKGRSDQELRAPSIHTMITTLYGEENGERIQIAGDRMKQLRSTFMTDLIPCVIERKPLPGALAKQAFSNSKRRNSYKNTWSQQLRLALCVLTKHYKDIGRIKEEEKNHMLDEQNLDRSYLYGRLLALYERIENDAEYFANRRAGENSAQTGEAGSEGSKRNDGRSTNAQRLWAAYTASPSSTHLILRNKVQVYLELLRKRNSGRANYLDRIIQDVILKLEVAQKVESNPNKSLDESFLFGYYGQSQALFGARKKQESDGTEEQQEPA